MGASNNPFANDELFPDLGNLGWDLPFLTDYLHTSIPST